MCAVSVGRGPLKEFLTFVAFSKGLCRPLGYTWRDEGSSWGGLGRGYWEGSWESVMASGLVALGSLWGPPSPSTPIEAVPDPPGGSVSCEALGSRVRPGTAPVTAHSPEALLVLENPLCPPRSAPGPHPVILSEVVDQARRGWREQMAGTGQAREQSWRPALSLPGAWGCGQPDMLVLTHGPHPPSLTKLWVQSG